MELFQAGEFGETRELVATCCRGVYVQLLQALEAGEQCQALGGKVDVAHNEVPEVLQVAKPWRCGLVVPKPHVQ